MNRKSNKYIKLKKKKLRLIIDLHDYCVNVILIINLIIIKMYLK